MLKKIGGVKMFLYLECACTDCSKLALKGVFLATQENADASILKEGNLKT
jgi:hypothetical protein